MDGADPRMDWPHPRLRHMLLLAALEFLMISRFPYSGFKSVTFDRRVPFVRMLLVVAVLGLIALDPPVAIWGMSVLYALSGRYCPAKCGSIKREGAKDHDKTELH